ncbi:hypothetical protein U2060_14870, partial [Listeria monocytogenes]|uniref:hypothetical protein n=1 Tax=Listeria monocytogenes TaxID=1639 RepID=UPI002FDBE94C
MTVSTSGVLDVGNGPSKRAGFRIEKLCNSVFSEHWMSLALLQFPDDPARFLRREFGVGGKNNGHGLQ